MKNYTLPQIELFTTALNSIQSDQAKIGAIAARAGQASAADFKKFIRGK